MQFAGGDFTFETSDATIEMTDLRIDRSMSRRQVLRVTAGVTATAGVTGIASATQDGSGICVLVYDDSPIEDYTKTFPVHQATDAPACVAAVPGYLGDDGQLSRDQLQEIASTEWEVLSHTMHHQPIGGIPVTDDVDHGQRRIPVTFAVHGQFSGAPVRLLDDTGTAFTETVAGQRATEGEQSVVLEDGADDSVDGSASPRLRFTTDYIETTLARSKDALEEMGMSIGSAVAPHQIYGEYAASQMSDFYTACANGRLENGINDEVDPYWLDRSPMTEPSLSTIRDRARTVAKRDGLFLLGGHSWNEQLTEDRIAGIIEIVREAGLTITTLNEVLGRST